MHVIVFVGRFSMRKEDYVHFYSAHGERVKSGIVIGFFLRAFRICDEEYLPEDIQHIFDTFIKRKYPKGFICKQNKKAEEIMRNKRKMSNRKTKPAKWISILLAISRELEKVDVRVVSRSGRTIQELATNRKEKKTEFENSVVYELPCAGCSKTYVDETGRGVQTRLKEHRSDVKFHRTSNAIVLHIDTCNHLPKWKETKILERNVKNDTEKHYRSGPHHH